MGLGLDFKRTFLATIPWMLLYLLSFHCLVRRPPPAARALNSAPGLEALPRPAGAESGWQRFQRCGGYCCFVTTNLCLVYIFEYVISSGLAAKVLPAALSCSYTAAAACESTAGCGWQNATAADLECPGSHVTGTCVAEGFTERNVYAIFGFCCKIATLFLDRLLSRRPSR